MIAKTIIFISIFLIVRKIVIKILSKKIQNELNKNN